MIDIGLRSQADHDELTRTIQLIDTIEWLHGELFDSNFDLADWNGKVRSIAEGLPDPPVDIRHTLNASLQASQGCISQIGIFLKNNVPTSPVVLQALLRTSLLGSGRVIYVLGPEGPETRLANANIVLRQDSNSLIKAYAAFEKFEYSPTLRPTPEVLAPQRARFETLRAQGPPIGEEKVLAAMSRVVEEALKRKGYAMQDGSLGERITWLFHVCSGSAHGFGWPRLVPGTESMPGVFLADLSLVAAVAHLAITMAGDGD